MTAEESAMVDTLRAMIVFRDADNMRLRDENRRLGERVSSLTKLRDELIEQRDTMAQIIGGDIGP